MALANTKPLRFSPQGVSDALAEEDAFPGACAALSNLIPDPTTKNLWTPRPASTVVATLNGGSASGDVSVFKVVGGLVYGLYAYTGGFDEPFCYNLVTSAFESVTITGGSAYPTTQSTSGDWTPPTMDVMGHYVVVTHPGFDGTSNFIGWFDITTPTAPIWNSGNFTLASPLVTVRIAFAGSGYTNGTYNNIPLLDGTGAGATANIVVSSNHVATVTIVNGGLGYKVGDALSVNNALIGGGTGFVAIAATVTGSGIAEVAILTTGTGYTNAYYTNVPLSGGTGSGAEANIVVENGSVVSVLMSAPGNGYLINDVLGSGGVITALGAITAGSGYTDGTYSGMALLGGTGMGATANITVSGGAVTATTIVNGGVGYVSTDSITTAVGGALITLTISNAGNGNVPTGVYIYGTANSTSGIGTGATFTFVGPGGTISGFIVNSPGQNYAIGDVIRFNFDVTLTVATVTTVGPIGPGTGWSVKAGTVSSSPLGSGTGFLVQVGMLTNPGGYINFTTVPSWVRQFNGRSWFGINPPTGIPSVIFSDVYALNCTNANQALSFGDNTPLTAAATLGLANLLGGVVQSLIIFKSLDGIIQVTGDATTNNLSVNQVPGGSGTISPRSVCEHPQGLLYLDHDGFRMVTLDGNCTDPIGVAGQGVVVPFLNPVTTTRVNAACNGTILRVSVDTAANGWEEYWFDSVRKVWSGPHSFPSTMVDVYEGDFILVAEAVQNKLFLGQAVPTPGSTFTENGTLLTWTYQTVVLNDNQQMAQSEVAEMQVKTNCVTGLSSITVAAIENGTTINSATYTYPGNSAIVANRIDFNAPVVYNRLTIEITGSSYAGFKIGDIFVRVRILGYLQALPV